MLNSFTFIQKRVNKTENGENQVFEGKIEKDITVVLDVGDVTDVLGLGGGVVEELRLNLGVGQDLRQQLIDKSELCLKLGSADTCLHGGPKCRNNLHSSAHNIVVTMGGGDANEDKHALDDNYDNIDHKDFNESQMIEQYKDFITLTLLLGFTFRLS